MSQATDRGDGRPQPLGEVLSRLIALRGYGRVQGQRQLADVWREAAGEKIAAKTKVMGIKNGVLQVGVSNAALLSELASFHRHSLLEALQASSGELAIRDVKFRLRAE
jgi:predicted nucleic acid-binding Zn ribbon protein